MSTDIQPDALKKSQVGNSLMVQGLRLCVPDTGGMGTRSHMPQLRLYAAK